MGVSDVLGIISLYFGVESLLNGGSMILSDKIRDEEELEGMLKEEMKKFGLSNKSVSAKFGRAQLGVAHAEKFPDGKYEVVLDRLGRNRSALRHELYHIYSGHLDSKIETIASLPGFLLKRIFVHEPSAILYQFGLNGGRK